VPHWFRSDGYGEIGGFYEELLTIPTEVADFPFQKGAT
jgi:hypothetical protein